MHCQWFAYQELTVDLLYAILKLRAEIFVVEQQCIYLDPDDKDKDALHLVVIENNSLQAYLRLFPATTTQNYLVFGRIVTANTARGKGYGKFLMQELLNYCRKNYPEQMLHCSAQCYLQSFYESFGLKAIGEPYDEDGIDHIHMQMKIPANT